jgi:hypothetical protein
MQKWFNIERNSTADTEKQQQGTGVGDFFQQVAGLIPDRRYPKNGCH